MDTVKVPSTIKKRKIEGLSRGSDVYRQLRPRKFRETIKTVHPKETDLNKSSIYTFDINAAKQELVGFFGNIFRMKYLIYFLNLAYREGEDDPSKIEFHKYLYPQCASVNKEKVDHPFYADLRLGGSAFFKTPNVQIDGQSLWDVQHLEHMQHHYQLLNRTFCSEATLKEKFGEPCTRVLCEKDRRLKRPADTDIEWTDDETDDEDEDAVDDNGQPVQKAPKIKKDDFQKFYKKQFYANRTLHPDVEESAEFLHFESETGAKMRHCSFTFDGVFPFSCQNLTLKEMTGDKKECVYLHEGARIVVKLPKRDDLMSLIQRYDFKIKDYFDNDNDALEPNTDNLKLMLDIKEIVLEYSSLFLDTPELKKEQNVISRYRPDAPLFHTYLLAPKVMYTEIDIHVPVGTRLMYVGFMHERQMIKQAGFHQATFMRFPPNLIGIRFYLAGRDDFIHVEGLKDLGTKDICQSHTLFKFYEDLSRKGAYDKPINKVLNRPDNESYDHALPYPFLPVDVSQLQILRTVLTFDTNKSPARWNCTTYSIVEKQIEFTTSNGAIQWSQKTIV